MAPLGPYYLYTYMVYLYYCIYINLLYIYMQYEYDNINILWVTTQTQLSSTPPQKRFFFPWQGSGLSSLGRIMLKSQGLMVVVVVSPCFWQIFQTGCSMIFDCPVDRSWCAQRCCDGAATESLLRRSRCCDGVAAATEMRRPAPSRSFCASRPRRS